MIARRPKDSKHKRFITYEVEVLERLAMRDTLSPNKLIQSIDGPLFREQRLELLRIVNDPTTRDPDGRTVTYLQGLINLLDAVAYTAHDCYGIDCLITEDECAND